MYLQNLDIMHLAYSLEIKHILLLHSNFNLGYFNSQGVLEDKTIVKKHVIDSSIILLPQ